MSLREFLDLLRKRKWVVIASTATCLAIAATVVIATPRTYVSRIQLFVSAQDQAADGNLTSIYQGGLFTQQRVQSYVDIATSNSVTEPVIEKLGLRLGPDALAEKITAKAPSNTVLIDLGVSDRDPETARKLAAALGTQFISVIDDLERPTSGGSSPVKLSVSRSASAPTSPTTPRTKLDLLAGLLFGLVLGVALAVALERLDTSIRGADELEARGLVTLGEIPKDTKAPAAPTVAVNGHTPNARVEAMRQLRTNLRFVNIANPPKSIIVTSPLAGDGKTTTTLNLASSMAQAGLRVIVVEGDLRRSSITHYLEMPSTGRGITSVLVGEDSVDDVLLDWGDTGHLKILPAGRQVPNASELLASDQMRHLLQQLRDICDIVLIDTPPLLPVTDAAVLASQTDGALLVINHGRTTRAQLDAATEVLSKVNAQLLGVVLNEVPYRLAPYYGDVAA